MIYLKRVFLILFYIVILNGCNHDEPAVVRIDNWFAVRLGEKVKIIDDRNHVLFVSLVEIDESRCPSDAFCIQPGRVLTKLVIEDSRNSQFSTLLCLGDCSPSITQMRSFVLYNIEYTLILREVNPYPETGNPDNVKTAVVKLFRNN